jgi:hypothetical protein
MPEIQVTLLGRFAVTVGGVAVAGASWKRRHAAAVVKVLALAPGQRLHREQVIDLVWPEDTIAEAVLKLHKAAHFARRAIGVPDAVVLRGDQVVLCPGGSVTVLIRRYVAEPPAELVKLVTTLVPGVPFLVTELARRAVLTPGAGPGSAAAQDWGQALQASMFTRLRPTTHEVLQRVAVAGASFDTDEFAALSGVSEEEAFGYLDDALAAGIVEPVSAGYRFRHCLIRDALTGDVPAHRRRQVHRDTALRLVELGASPARIGHHFLAAGAGADAVPCNPNRVPPSW